MLIDQGLIYVFQKISDQVHMETGLNNFKLALICLFLPIIFVARELLFIDKIFINGIGQSTDEQGVKVVVFFTATAMFFVCSRFFKELEKNLEENPFCANQEKINSDTIFFRMLLLVLNIVFAILTFTDPAVTYYAILFGSMLFAFYFSSCDTLPPCKGRLFQRPKMIKLKL